MALISGLLTADQSSLLDLNPYTLAAGWSVSNGVATKVATSGTATLTVTVPIISGRTYALMINMIGGDPGGVIGPFFGGPFGGIATSNTNASAPHVWLMTAEQDHTVIQIGANAQFTGSISDIQVRDVTDALSRPAVIVGVWGQSPFAVEDSAEQIDNDLDGWTDDRLYYYAGSTNAGYQAVAGEIAPLTAALQQAQNADGVSPAIAYAQNLLSLIPDGFNLLLVPYARGGTTLYGAGAGWAVGGAQYTQFITNMQAAKALNGQNTHLAIIGGQGQSNLSETVDQDWPAAWSAVLTQMRADLSEPELGSYLLGPPPDVDATQIALLIEGQTATDADSGDPRSIANNYFVPFPAGYVEADGVHANAEGNRLGGTALAARHVAVSTATPAVPLSIADVGVALQKGIVAALKADADFGEVCGDRIYDEVPGNAQVPYAHFGPRQVRPWFTDGTRGRETVVQIDVYDRSQGAGRVRAEQAMNAIIELLDGNESLAVDGHHIALADLSFSNVSMETDKRTARAILRFRYLTHPI